MRYLLLIAAYFFALSNMFVSCIAFIIPYLLWSEDENHHRR